MVLDSNILNTWILSNLVGYGSYTLYWYAIPFCIRVICFKSMLIAYSYAETSMRGSLTLLDSIICVIIERA